MYQKNVAPLAGAWIEIFFCFVSFDNFLVAPLAGAWIEIYLENYQRVNLFCRSPRGSVD